MGSLGTSVISLACSDLTPKHRNEFCGHCKPPDLVEPLCRRLCRDCACDSLCVSLPQPGSPSGAEQQRSLQHRGAWPAPETRSFSLHPRGQLQIAPAAPESAPRPAGAGTEAAAARPGRQWTWGLGAPATDSPLPPAGAGLPALGPQLPHEPTAASPRQASHFTTRPHGGPRGLPQTRPHLTGAAQALPRTTLDPNCHFYKDGHGLCVTRRHGENSTCHPLPLRTHTRLCPAQ